MDAGILDGPVGWLAERVGWNGAWLQRKETGAEAPSYGTVFFQGTIHPTTLQGSK